MPALMHRLFNKNLTYQVKIRVIYHQTQLIELLKNAIALFVSFVADMSFVRCATNKVVRKKSVFF